MTETLKPLDLVVLCKLIANTGRTYDFLSESLGISRSQIHQSIKRLEVCGLLRESIKVNKKAFMIFVLGGARFCFPAHEEKGICQGIPTGLQVVGVADAIPLVWPNAENDKNVSGRGIRPLHPCAMGAVHDQKFWALLALIDAIRVGDDREMKIAVGLMRDGSRI